MKQRHHKRMDRLRRKEEEKQAARLNRKRSPKRPKKQQSPQVFLNGKEVPILEVKVSSRDDMEKSLRDQIMRSFGAVSVPRSFQLDIAAEPPLTPEQRLEQERDELKRRLDRANQKTEEQDAFLKEITDGALTLGTVISVDKDRKGTVASGNQIICCTIPNDAKPGDRVRIIPKSSQPVDIATEAVDAGEVCTVTGVLDDVLEIALGTGARTVARGGIEANEGDRVVVDQGYHVALRNLGPAEKAFNFEATDGITWDDIGGLEDAKEALREAIEFPASHADLFAAYGAKASKGALLYGPPGCGKTMLGKAAASAMSARGDSGGFIYVKGPEILSMWVGEAESTVRSLFRQARAYKKQTGQSAVLFIDEAEAVLAARDTSGFRGSIQSTLVPAFLAEMDGLEDSGAFVLLSTNHPGTLDPAVTRDGRIDRKIQVTRPGYAETLSILRLAIANVPTSIDLAEALCREAFDSSRVITKGDIGEIHFELLLSDVMSGALAAGLVSRATSLAMRRDRSSGKPPSGVTELDARKAVEEATKEQAHLDWTHEILMKAGSAAKDHVISKAAKAHTGVMN